MHPMLNTAFRAARKAGTAIMHGFDRLDLVRVSIKSGPHDYVTNIDKKAEEILIETLRTAYPSHGFHGEESGKQPGDGNLWIIDPLDGTSNFIHGIPHFSISIAFAINGRVEHALIYDPVKDELFTASRGRGAMLNNRRIRVSKQASLQGAFLAMGSTHRSPEHLQSNQKLIAQLVPAVAGIRRMGSVALDLAYVAAGRFDGFWDADFRTWDVAAGALLVQEAGGMVGDFSGRHSFVEKREIVAAPPKVFKELIKNCLQFGGRSEKSGN